MKSSVFPVQPLCIISGLAAAGIAAAGSIAAGAGSTAASSAIRNKKQWRYRKKEMALQQQYALEQMQKQYDYQMSGYREMFDYQNAYNDPSAVFERYRKAGINPAAVLGASGVGMSATLPSSGTSIDTNVPSASGQYSGGEGSGGSAVQNAIQASVIGQDIRESQSREDANMAAAERDNAEATRIRGDTHTPEWRAEIDKLDRAALEAGVKDAEALARLHFAQAELAEVDAWVADNTSAYKIEECIAYLAKLKEEYNQIRKYNIQYFDREMEAAISLTAMRAVATEAEAGLTQVQEALTRINVQDATNWFDTNWNYTVEIPRYNNKGEVVRIDKMTGKDIAAVLRGLEFQEQELGKGTQRWKLRSEKNRLGYDVTKAVSAAVAATAVSAATRGIPRTGGSSSQTDTGGTSSASEEMYERYDGDGRYIGGTRVTRSMTGETHSARRKVYRK